MIHDPVYPSAPGHRGVDTSIAAADGVAPNLGRLQRAVHQIIITAGLYGATTNEIAAALQIDRGSVQPRTSELKARGLIIDSHMRRLNANGKRAIVWTASPAGRAVHRA